MSTQYPSIYFNDDRDTKENIDKTDKTFGTNLQSIERGVGRISARPSYHISNCAAVTLVFCVLGGALFSFFVEWDTRVAKSILV